MAVEPPKEDLIEYVGSKDGWIEKRLLVSGSAAHDLNQLCRRASKALGCSCSEMVLFVLCGGQLPFRRIRVSQLEQLTISSKGSLPGTVRYQVTIMGQNVTQSDLLSAYRTIRGFEKDRFLRWEMKISQGVYGQPRGRGGSNS